MNYIDDTIVNKQPTIANVFLFWLLKFIVTLAFVIGTVLLSVAAIAASLIALVLLFPVWLLMVVTYRIL